MSFSFMRLICHLLVKYNKKTQKMYVFFIHAFNLTLDILAKSEHEKEYFFNIASLPVPSLL